MVKLSPELINQSMQCINPCRERELDLRGYKIPQIENLGATLDQFDTIDFSDNDLRKLDGFPYLPRLKCLLLNNNRLVRIDDLLHESIPNIESLIFTGNNIQELGDLEPLTHFKNLQTLCLLVNPVSTKPFYREYMAYRFPNLRLLDFRKIKQKHKKEAQEFFKSKKGKDLLKEISKKISKPSNDGRGGGIMRGASPEEIQKIREAIKKAKNLQEIERLTQILQTGQIPENFFNGNGVEMMES
uniref:Probable U2 small nuclear ribonucleoprotein A' n=1 Tax=Megaselia scalaris TaxID=36166 RepID=T1GP17_MEGSC